MRYLKHFLAGAAVLAAAATVTAFAAAGSASGTVVKVGPSTLGRVLVDSHGTTRYTAAHDKGAKTACNGQGVEYWPPPTTRGKPSARAGAQAGLLGTSRRRDGRLQVTYAGHPLYYFVKDAK